ncbi:hypothetical protein DEO72_LG5g1407 [Vigna unguiculata]|uniref:Uncharacterized protein n=1 Tax=Vigna unguiculata TaxID=3917 RepID=A0A4D6LZS8_VIGUN|nr:hypothetical protein DEO72_LG5g1407 [Vigna unguiculata]
MDGNLSTNGRRNRKSIVSTNISNMMMNSSDIDQRNYKNARARRKVIRDQKIAEKKIHGSTSIGSGMVCNSIEITNGPILHKTNINNKDQKFAGSTFIPASVASSSYSEVVNLFDVEQNQSHDICKLQSYTSAISSQSSQYLEAVKLGQPSLHDVITPISKILDFDNNSDEDENHDYLIGHFSSDLYSRAEVQG